MMVSSFRKKLAIFVYLDIFSGLRGLSMDMAAVHRQETSVSFKRRDCGGNSVDVTQVVTCRVT